MVDKAIDHTMKRNINVNRLSSSIELMSVSKRPDPESKMVSRAAEIMGMSLILIQKRVHHKYRRSVNVTGLLSVNALKALATASGCLPHMQPPTCHNSCLARKYRSINGNCNNRNNPSWGASNTALVRWLAPSYEDGFSQPKGWNADHTYRGFKLPLVREVTNKILRIANKTKLAEDRLYSHILVEWGQYIDHDFAFTPQSVSQAAFHSGVDCKNMCQNMNPCFPIKIITMRDYIPKILGSQAFDRFMGKYEGYSERLNPTLSNVFATAAFRFGHTTISPRIQRLDESYKEHATYPSINLHKTFFSPWRIIKEGGLDPLLRGLLAKPAKLQTPNQMMIEELTEKLFALTDAVALDLASLNLQRGRDHGLPGYNEWREFCKLERLETKTDLRKAISDLDSVEKIMDLYGHPDNIDIWLGGLAEDFLPGARVGPLFACLIGKQMKALREGDRFWWENPGLFSSAQRNELYKHSLSRVICDNTAITEVPLDAFRVGQYPQNFVNCDQVPGLNLLAWNENPQQVGSCGPPPQIEDGEFVLCTSSRQSIISYVCHHGFYLLGPEELTCSIRGWSSDPPACKDINECEDAARPACHSSASCVNMKGSYRCTCSDPYLLSEDGHSCTDNVLHQ
ncbi:thyroid peroxidase [Amblyraja radiata]|uniref:thyroid peroxidase n=1 Tax=Amblyraja radiata TaxID=386614 RepID=UPI001402A47E|nr:thyroid peroxidase [Amblyraja radiata]